MSDGRRRRFPAYDGTGLAYRTLGSGPLLVCLPGGPGRAADYLEDLGGLAATRTLVLPDTRGTGASDLPADERSYTAETLADDVDALRAHLGVETVDVLGHSAGGVVAMVLAATRPAVVRRLVVVTSALGPDDDARQRVRALRTGEPWYAQAAEAAEGLAYAPPGERTRLEQAMRPFWYGGWGPREQAHAASADTQVAPRASSRFRVMTAPEQLRAGLAAYDRPVLVVAGGLDALTPPSASRELAAALPRARLVELAGAGHFPWVDDGPRFAAAVEGFLAEPAAP